MILEHAIKPGKYIFFELSSCKSGDGDDDENAVNYRSAINMKIEVEFCKHGVVDGMVISFKMIGLIIMMKTILVMEMYFVHIMNYHTIYLK